MDTGGYVMLQALLHGPPPIETAGRATRLEGPWHLSSAPVAPGLSPGPVPPRRKQTRRPPSSRAPAPSENSRLWRLLDPAGEERAHMRQSLLSMLGPPQEHRPGQDGHLHRPEPVAGPS